MRYVLSLLESSLGLAVIAMVISCGVLAVSYFVFRRIHNGKKCFPWGKALLGIFFAGYLGVLLYATILRGRGYYQGQMNLHIFRAWKEAWNQFTVQSWANLLLNIALFIPVGFFLPLLWKKARAWYITIPLGFSLTIVIELLQLITGRGLFDVDDLLCNLVGAIIGFLFISFLISFRKQKGERKKPALIYGISTFLLVLVILGVFPVYALQEYGNLSCAPSYTQNVQNVKWNLDCQLPDGKTQLPTYQSQKRTKKDCDQFAREFVQGLGLNFSDFDIMYYNDSAYYTYQGASHQYHFLMVDYKGTGYEYSWGYSDRDAAEPVWVEGTRLELEKALKPYPVMVPEYAEFSYKKDGYAEFKVDKHLDGAVMVDGLIRCRYADDHTVRKIENKLDSYIHYDFENVITPEQALTKLKQGHFQEESFAYSLPKEVDINACTLSYEIDSKGFYQPVYVFQIQFDEIEIPLSVKIPAIL